MLDDTSPPAMPGASLTAASARRMIRSAARLMAVAGLSGVDLDAALAEGREAFRDEVIRIQRERDRT